MSRRTPAEPCLPESKGQHDRDEVEIMRGEVPKPHGDKVRLGTSSRAPLSGRAALLTQEGVTLLTNRTLWAKPPGKARAILLLCLLFLSACRQDMAEQGRLTPMGYSAFFKDGRIARTQPLGTVARTQLHEDALLYTGMQNSKLSPTFPFPITRDILKRGQQRYDIFCAPCHDRAGTGKGLAVQNGFERGPESFHQQRLRDAAPGYFYQAIANGFGIMNGYGAQIPPEDRWAIVAYVRALQLSENAVVADLPEDDKKKLETAQ